MEDYQAINALAALAQEHRLQIFRLLARQGEEGLAAGKIAELLDLPGATLSFHLKELTQAALILRRRESRSIIYSLNTSGVRCLLSFLLDDCCEGHPELCGLTCHSKEKQKPASRRRM